MPRIMPRIEDPSWDVMPVASPDLPARKRKKLVDRAVLKDPIGLEEPAYQLQERELIVVPSTLDQLSRELLLRVQQAVGTALDTEAGAMTPDAAAAVGPMTNAVLNSQERALAQAQEAIMARVAELERYADSVRAAGAAYQDWQDALRVAGLNDRYLDLVARTAADEYAVAEISGLTERAVAAQTFQQALQKVSLAAAALELPSFNRRSSMTSLAVKNAASPKH
jgi:hypothetical protein